MLERGCRDHAEYRPRLSNELPGAQGVEEVDERWLPIVHTKGKAMRRDRLGVGELLLRVHSIS